MFWQWFLFSSWVLLVLTVILVLYVLVVMTSRKTDWGIGGGMQTIMVCGGLQVAMVVFAAMAVFCAVAHNVAKLF